MKNEQRQLVRGDLKEIWRQRIYKNAVAILASYGGIDSRGNKFFGRPTILPVYIQKVGSILAIYLNGRPLFKAEVLTKTKQVEAPCLKYSKSYKLAIYIYEPGDWTKMIDPVKVGAQIKLEQGQVQPTQKTKENLNKIAHSLGIVTPSQS